MPLSGRLSATCHDRGVALEVGQMVEYIAEPVFDLIIQTGDIGRVTRVENGWVHAVWPRSGEHSVPVVNVRPAQTT